MRTTDTSAADQPWKGLDFYTEGDTKLFFGREKEELELLRFVRRETLTVLFGTSGTGKTSLLYAGLFGRLRKENYLPIPIRRLQFGSEVSLVQQTKALIEEALIGSGTEVERSTPLTGDETLWEYLHRSEFWNKRNQLVSPVLVFDQFEEVFTLGHHLPETEAFLVELADLVENYVPVRFLEKMQSENTRLDFPYEKQRYKIVVALRDDFVHRLDGLRSTMPSIMRNRYRLKRLSHDHAMEAVLGPGKAIVDEGVARAIVDWVAAADMNEAGPEAPRPSAGEIEVEPAILSLVCRELNRRRSAAGHDRIELEDLRESQTDILTDFYEDSFKDLDPRARVFVEDRLITGSGFRTAVPLEDAGEIGDAIEALMQRRLIRSEERLGIPHVELSHDRLTDLVLASRRDREDRRNREEEVRKEHELQEEEDRKRTAVHKAREARSSRILNRVLAGVVAILLVAGSIILYQMGQVNFQMEQVSIAADTAKAWELALQATASLEDDPELSIILGLHSAALTKDLEVGVLPTTVEVLNQALARSREVMRFELGSRTVSSIVFTREGQTVATEGADGGVKTWDLDTGNELASRTGEEAAITSLSGDGTRLAVAIESAVSVHDINAGTEVFRQEFGGLVSRLVLADDGTRFAVAIEIYDPDQPIVEVIEVWNVGGNRVLSKEAPRDMSLAEFKPVLVFSGNGKRLAVTDSGDGITVWDIETARELRRFPGFSYRIASIALDFEGTRLAATLDTPAKESSGSGSLWDVDSGDQLLTADLRAFPADNVLTFGRNSTVNHLAIAKTGGSLTVWDLESETEVFTFAGHSGSILGITFDPAGSRVATVGNDGTARIWSLDNMWLPDVDGSEPIWAIALSPDGTRFATVNDSGQLRIVPESSRDSDVDDIIVWSVGYSPGGDLAAAGGDILDADGFLAEGILKVWPNGDTGRAPDEFRRPFEFLAVAYSPDGDHLATSSFDRRLRVSYSGEPDREPLSTGLYGRCEGLAFDPVGERLAASCWNKTAAVWNLADLRLDSEVEDESTERPESLTLLHDDIVNSIAFSNDGERLATAGNDGIVTMWDSRTGKKLFVVTGHDAGVSGVAFRPAEEPDGPTWLATSSFDGTVRQYLFDTDELMNLAWRAIARQSKSLTDRECQRYLQESRCEPPDVRTDSPEDR